MLLALSDISFGNLACGTLRISSLTPQEASIRLQGAIDAGDLMGLYDFGPVPNKQIEERFHELLGAIDDALGIAVPPGAFFSASDDEMLTFPIPYNLARISPPRPLLLMQYSLEMDVQALEAQRIHAAKGERSLERAEFDALLVDTLFPIKLSADSLKFYLLELLDSQEPAPGS